MFRSRRGGHLLVGFERSYLDASRGEQTRRLSGAGADFECLANGFFGVLHHRVDQLVGVVESVALVLVCNRPERQPPDQLCSLFTVLSGHNLYLSRRPKTAPVPSLKLDEVVLATSRTGEYHKPKAGLLSLDPPPGYS